MKLSRAGSRVPAQSPVPPEVYSPFQGANTKLINTQDDKPGICVHTYVCSLSLQNEFSKELRLPSGGKFQALGIEQDQN